MKISCDTKIVLSKDDAPMYIYFTFEIYMQLSDRLIYFDSFGFQVNKIPPWRFEISESAVRDLSSDIVVVWNQGVRSFKSLSSGGDWIKFFKVQFYSLCSPNMKNISLLSFPKTKHKNRLQDHCISSN